MRTIKLTIQYDGTEYYGWQMQASHISVQQVLQEALAIVCNHPVVLHGSGRTDTGVHALGQVAHFKTALPYRHAAAAKRPQLPAAP